MYAKHMQKEVTEYLQSSEYRKKSDMAIDQAILLMPESITTLVWNGFEGDKWDLNRLVVETRRYREQVPYYRSRIDRALFELIVSLKMKDPKINLFVNNIQLCGPVNSKPGDHLNICYSASKLNDLLDYIKA